MELDALLRDKTVNRKKLLAYGFLKAGESYQKSFPVLENQFRVEVSISADGRMDDTVVENETNEVYALAKVESASGSFVGAVRSSRERVWTEVVSRCFDTERLKAEQTKRMVQAISAEYGVEPEFLWEKTPDAAAFRRKDNAKWFAVLMTVERSKLGLEGHGKIEILDLKGEPKRVASLLQTQGVYPAYHMNKTHWFTVCLDGSIPDATLFQLISASYACSAKK